MQHRASQVHVVCGEFADGARLLIEVLRAIDAGVPTPRLFGQILTSVQAPSSLATALSEQGDFAAAIRAGARALAEAEREEHRYSQAVALAVRGGVYLRQGEFEAAQPLLERALELSRELELSLTLPGVTVHLGLV